MKTCSQCGPDQTYPSRNVFCPIHGSPLYEVEGLTPGMVIRRKFRIIRELGRGGMGVVYLAEHLLLRQERALKLINRQYSTDPDAVRRFQSEAIVANKIDDPHVARVYDADETEDGQPYVVMEYVSGYSLRQILRQREGVAQPALDPLRAIEIASQVCAGLASAHREGIIHRDIKPDNILITESDDGDLVKVVDFGVAKAKRELHGTTIDAQLSKSGMFVGTPQYCSPEQAVGTKGDLLDHRTDIYSLGVVLYEMLLGQPPFTGPDVLHDQQVTPPPTAQAVRPNHDIPEELMKVAMKALEKVPEQRFASAEKMRDALHDAREAIRRTRQVQVPLSASLIGKPHEAPQKKVSAAAVPERPPQIEMPRRAWPVWTTIIALLVTIVLSVLAYRIFVLGPATPPQKIESVDDARIQEKLVKAKQFYEQRVYDQAITVYREVQALDPSNAEARDGINIAETAKTISEAEASIDRGDYDIAIASLQEVLRRDPQNGRARTALDTALEKKVLGK